MLKKSISDKMDKSAKLQDNKELNTNNNYLITGVILAGGSGKRLRPLTENLPKSLLEIQKDYCITDKLLKDLKNIGINNIMFLTSYLGDKIIERYGKLWNGLNISYSSSQKQLGTWGSIKKAVFDDKLTGKLLILNGDIVTDVSLESIINNNTKVTILGIPLKSQYGILHTNGQKVLRFEEKPKLPYYINGGAYFIKNITALMAEFNHLHELQNSIEYDIFPKIAEDANLGIHIEYDTNILWRSIDSIKDLDEVRELYKIRTDKPWGYELLVSYTDKYLQKKLYIKENYKTSMHYHKNKLETLYVVYGRICLDLEGGKSEIINEGQSRTINPGEIHSIVALKNTLIDESSTPYLDDTVRIKDFYTR